MPKAQERKSDGPGFKSQLHHFLQGPSCPGPRLVFGKERTTTPISQVPVEEFDKDTDEAPGRGEHALSRVMAGVGVGELMEYQIVTFSVRLE